MKTLPASVVLLLSVVGYAPSAMATCSRDYFESAVFAAEKPANDLVAECRDYLLNTIPDRKDTLVWIVAFGDVKLVQALMDIGYEIDADRDFDLLFNALGAEEDPADMVALLLSKGLSVDVADEERNILYHAIELGHSRTLQLLTAKLNDKRRLYASDHLFAAVLPNDLAMAEQILDRGGDPNFADELGITPLMVAAARGSIEMVRLFIRRGGDCWKTSSLGSAFALARAEDVLAVLRDECASVD